MHNEPSGDYYDYTKTMQPERPFLLDYHQSLVYLIMICTRDGEGKLDTVYRTFEDVVAAVRKVHHLTCGMPQIIYLCGWHHEGHDSKYPDWSEANRHLKRDCDETALDSLRWMIREGRKVNATISLHLNMMDAYTDSPLWDEYVTKDIIAKDMDGKLIKGKEWSGAVSYQLSYAQEWKMGLAQKRIDGIIEMIPELVEGKTIHIDAFLGARPEAPKEPISPYTGFTKADELATQRKIFRYWRDRGIDVTSEWVNGFRDGDRMVGLQAWAWHLGGGAIDDLPPHLYCTNPMDEARHLDGSGDEIPAKLLEEFCLILMPWYYKNHSGTSDDPMAMIDDGDICMPALWCEQPTLIAYSREGYAERTWPLPPDWADVAEVEISRLTTERSESATRVSVGPDGLALSLAKDEGVCIVPVARLRTS